MNDRTVYSLLEEAVEKFGTKPALYQPRPGKRDDKYQIYNWIDYKQAVEEIAAGLRRLGVKKGDIVGLNAETRAEFYLADLGIMVAGGVSAASYTSYPAENLANTFRSCEARVIFVENPKMLAELRAAADSGGDVQWILLTGDAADAVTFEQLRQTGAGVITDDNDSLPNLRAEMTPDDYAILYMTSGATGEPKMGLVTHRAIVANVDMGPEVIDIGPADATIGFLPSAHITQRIAGQMIPLRMRAPGWSSWAKTSISRKRARSALEAATEASPRSWSTTRT